MFDCPSYSVPENVEDADAYEDSIMPPWWVCVWLAEAQERSGEAGRPNMCD